jgi:hypothetical protein
VPAGCGGSGPDRGDYLRANERLFAELPTFPGSHVQRETTSSYHDDESGPVAGYSTRFELALPPSADAAAVGTFYRSRLAPQWRLVERLDGAVVNFRRGEEFVSINVDNASAHRFEIAVDHAYGGNPNR